MEPQTKGEPMELISYGIFKQDFYAVVKQYGKYILHRMMPVPECSYFNEPGIEEHIREFEDDECSDQYVFTKQEDCFRMLLSGAGDKRKGRECMAAGNPVFTDEELLLLSGGILSLINGAQEALKLVDYDHAVHFAVLKALDKYRDLNAKVCSMISESCE